MSLCWKIYHFLHHKFSKNTNKPPQMHRPVIRMDIQKKKNCAKKCLFWPPRGCEKMVIFHTSHLQKKIILISSHFAIEPWDPWNTLPNSRRSNLNQKIQKNLNSKNTLICHCARKLIIFFIINSQKTQINHPRCTDLWSESIFRKKKKIAKKCLLWPPRGCEKMVIFHTSHLQKKIILISSHFAIEPWDPWNTLPNSRRSNLNQKIQNSKKFEF